jgi:hypothetical protein
MLNFFQSELEKEYIFQYNSSRLTMKCSECDCVMDLCKEIDFKHCMRCTKQKCCCITIHKLNNKQNSTLIFFYNTRTLFAAALGIEILCIWQQRLVKIVLCISLAIICKVLFLDTLWDTQQQDLQLL